MTQDELVEAIRAGIASRAAPASADRDRIAEFEQISGHRLPPLLARLLTEVANGGFGPRNAVFGVRGHNWHTNGMFEDMTEAALAARNDPEYAHLSWCVPLIDWGCAIMTLIDCRNPDGPLWGWDPNGCCLEHALSPLDQTLAEMLEESLTAEYPEPFYDGYAAAVRASEPGCAPLQWREGRVKPRAVR